MGTFDDPTEDVERLTVLLPEGTVSRLQRLAAARNLSVNEVGAECLVLGLAAVETEQT